MKYGIDVTLGVIEVLLIIKFFSPSESVPINLDPEQKKVIKKLGKSLFSYIICVIFMLIVMNHLDEIMNFLQR